MASDQCYLNSYQKTFLVHSDMTRNNLSSVGQTQRIFLRTLAITLSVSKDNSCAITSSLKKDNDTQEAHITNRFSSGDGSSEQRSIRQTLKPLLEGFSLSSGISCSVQSKHMARTSSIRTYVHSFAVCKEVLFLLVHDRKRRRLHRRGTSSSKERMKTTHVFTHKRDVVREETKEQ